MGLELGTYIDDLIQTNPLGSDDKRQGDDHLRLLKKVLQNTIKRASKAFYLPSSVLKTSNYTVLDSDENMTIQCNTAAAFTLTLPSLDTTRAGWTINIVKTTSDMNPVFLAPAAGTINGFAKVRRSVPATITQVVWTGSAWVASRPHGAPVGSVLEYYGTTLPQGHLWANGGAIDGANYVEAAAVLGTNTPDRRGRSAFGRDDMGGSAANRVTLALSGVRGNTLLDAGGGEAVALTTAQLPSHTHPLRSNVLYGGNLGISTDVSFSGNPVGHYHGWGSIGLPGSNGQVDGVTGRFWTIDSYNSGYDLSHSHGFVDSYFAGSNQTAPGPNPPGGSNQTQSAATDSSGVLNHAHKLDIGGYTNTQSEYHYHYINGDTQPTGSTATHNNMPPTIICNAIVVAE